MRAVALDRAFIAILVGLCLMVACSDEDHATDPRYVIPTNYPDIDTYPRWSGDGSCIVFYHTGVQRFSDDSATVDLSKQGLWTVDTLGVDAKFLLRAHGVHGEISGSGSKIAIAGGGILVADLLAGQLDTTSVRHLTNSDTDHFPAWSKGDTLIAYESNADGRGYRVHLMDASGVEKAALPGPSRRPDWFPDNESLAFNWIPIGTAGEVGIYDLATQGVQRLPGTSLVPDRWAQVSPFGNRLLFNRGSEIWIMDADGENARFLIQGHSPTWAPDGRRFAFVYRSFGQAKGFGTIWMTDVDRTFLRQLTRDLDYTSGGGSPFVCR